MKVFSNHTNLQLGNPFKVVYTNEFEDLIAMLPTQLEQSLFAQGNGSFEGIMQFSGPDVTKLFSQVRLSQDHLSLSETEMVKELIQEWEKDVGTLKEKIHTAISAVGQLCREITEASRLLTIRRDQIQLGQYLLSQPAIHDLPQDILEQIFLACYQSDGFFRPHEFRPPLQLAAVCHRWRQICLSMPKLWQFVYFSTTDTRSSHLAERFLNRSRFPQISIRYGTDPSSIEELFRHLKNPPLNINRPQIRALELDFTSSNLTEDDTPQPLNMLLDCDLDELEEVVIRDGNQREDIPIPNIKRFSSQGIPKSWTVVPPPAQLTNLIITDSLNWRLCEFIFAHCHLLQTVVVSLAELGVDGIHREAHPIQSLGPGFTHQIHPELRSLGLMNDFQEGGLPSTFLDSFSFPQLRAFEYYVEYEGVESLDWVTSRNFLPQIRHLTLHLTKPDPEIIMPIVTRTTSLQGLSLACPDAGFDSILQTFSQIPATISSSPPSDVLSNLKIFKFVSSIRFDDLKDSAPNFRELALAWSKSPERDSAHHCTDIRIYSWTGQSDGAVDLHKAIVGDGLDLEVEVVRFTPEYFIPGTPMAFETHRLPFATSIIEWDLMKDDVKFTRRFFDALL